jgi:hypothetical protein
MTPLQVQLHSIGSAASKENILPWHSNLEGETVPATTGTNLLVI